MPNDYLLAYGSLLNKFSREEHSSIKGPVFQARVSGWSRSWSAVYPDESATYAGAEPSADRSLDVLLVQTSLDQDLQHREREYRFTEIEHSEIEILSNSSKGLADARFYICEILAPQLPSNDCPLPQTYVDTCMHGCFEIGGLAAMHSFVEQTQGWGYDRECGWINDRDWAQPIYPRGQKLSKHQQRAVDSVLQEQNVLRYRTLKPLP